MFLLQHRKPHFMWLTVRTWSSLTCNTNHFNKVIHLPLWTLNLNIIVQSYLNILLKYNGVHKMHSLKGDFNFEINVLTTRNTHTNLCVGYLRLQLALQLYFCQFWIFQDFNSKMMWNNMEIHYGYQATSPLTLMCTLWHILCYAVHFCAFLGFHVTEIHSRH